MQMSSRTIGLVLLLAMCSCAISSHASTVTVGVLNVENVEAGTYLASQTDTMVNLMQSTANLRKLLNYDYGAIEMNITGSSTGSAQNHAYSVIGQESLSYVEAGYPASLTSISDLFVDPISLTPTLRSTNPHLLYLFPTVDQQLYVFSQYLGSNKPSKLVIISLSENIPGTPLSILLDMLKDCDVKVDSIVTMKAGMVPTDYMPTDGMSIILGLTADTSSPVSTFVKNTPGALTMILFDDFTMYYDDFYSAFGSGAASGSNLFLVTSLPPWIKPAAAGALTSDGSAALPARVLTETGYTTALNAYYTNVPATSQTPAGLRAFLTSLVANVAASHAGSPAAMRTSFFSGQTFAVGDMTFGPFRSTCHAPQLNCRVNYGATNIGVWNYGSFFQASAKPHLSMTPQSVWGYDGGIVDVQTGAYSNSYDNIFLWAILGVIAVMLLLLLILLLFCCCYPCFCCAGAGESRPSQSKQSSVTVVVVEIDDPSVLEAVDEMETSSVLKDVQNIVKQCASKFRCTITTESSSSYVLECAKAENAVRFGCAVQDDVRRQRSDAVAGMYGSGEGSNGFVRSMLQVRVGIHSGQRDCAPDAGDEQEMKVETCAASTCSLGRGGGKVLLTDATHKLLPSAADKKYHIEFFGDYSVGDDDGSQSIFVIAAPVVDAHDGILDEDEEVVGQGTGGEKMSRFSAVEVSEAYTGETEGALQDYSRSSGYDARRSPQPIQSSTGATAQSWIAPAAASAGVLGALHAEEVGRGDGPARVVDRSAPEQRSAPMELMASEEEARAMRERNAAAESHRDARVTEAKPQPPVVEEAAQERSAPMELMATEEESRVVKDAQPQRQARAAPVVAAAPVRSGSNQKTKSAVQERAAPMEMASAEESRAVKDVQPQRQTRAAPVAAAAAPIQGSDNQKMQPTVQERVQERAAPMELMASEEESRAVRNAPLREDRARETTAAPVAQSAPQTKPPLGADGGSRKPIAAAEDPSPYQTAEGMASYPPCKRCSELYGDDVVSAPKTADNEGSTGPCCPHCGLATDFKLPLSKVEMISRSTQISAR